MKPQKFFLCSGIAALVFAGTLPLQAEEDNQLMCLGGTDKPRFTVTDRTWPATPEAAEICLWKDDKIAACSVTIDDNCAPDHEWWLAMCKKYNLKVTFFIVTGGVDVKTKPFNGTWAGWQKLHDSGLVSLQSHTVSHFPDADKRSDEEILKQYKDSRDAINANIIGSPCMAMAAPNGKFKEHLVGEVYVANRGVYGVPARANCINYANVSKGQMSEACFEVLATGKTDKQPKWLNDKRLYRGWASPLFHFVRGDVNATEPNPVEKQLAVLASFSDRIWIDFFVDIARYGQERDTAKLKTVVSDDAIRLSITDRMKDELFTVPLTVKVRLPETWTGAVEARQGETVSVPQIVAHEGARFALVPCVPDQGECTLRRK